MIHYSRQQKEIIELCKDSFWHCHEELKKLMWNEHKRRGEIRDKGEYRFLPRKCTHGIDRSFDYQMTRIAPPEEKKEEKVESQQMSFSYTIPENHKIWTQ